MYLFTSLVQCGQQADAHLWPPGLDTYRYWPQGRRPRQARSGHQPTPALVQAQIARLSGACYLPWDDLKAAAQRERFHVLAGGDTYFTRWFLARGTFHGSEASATALFCRGVMWRSTELDSVRVWQALSQSWPAPFLEGKLPPLASGGVVQAHKGIAELSHELAAAVAPHLRGVDGAALLVHCWCRRPSRALRLLVTAPRPVPC